MSSCPISACRCRCFLLCVSRLRRSAALLAIHRVLNGSDSTFLSSRDGSSRTGDNNVYDVCLSGLCPRDSSKIPGYLLSDVSTCSEPTSTVSLSFFGDSWASSKSGVEVLAWWWSRDAVATVLVGMCGREHVVFEAIWLRDCCCRAWRLRRTGSDVSGGGWSPGRPALGRGRGVKPRSTMEQSNCHSFSMISLQPSLFTPKGSPCTCRAAPPTRDLSPSRTSSSVFCLRHNRSINCGIFPNSLKTSQVPFIADFKSSVTFLYESCRCCSYIVIFARFDLIE